MRIEYTIKDQNNRYIHRDILGKFGFTTSEALAERYETRQAAKNILENCLPKAMRKGFDVYEIMVEESVKDSENQEENQETEKTDNPGTPMNTIRPKVEEALRIANEPIVKNRMSDLAASFDSLKEIIGNITERKTELYESLSAIDSEISDINHYIELVDGLNAYQGYLAYRMLRQKLRQRRQIKDEILISKTIENCNISVSELSRISNCIAGLENRKYEPRVLDELFA